MLLIFWYKKKIKNKETITQNVTSVKYVQDNFDMISSNLHSTENLYTVEELTRTVNLTEVIRSFEKFLTRVE